MVATGSPKGPLQAHTYTHYTSLTPIITKEGTLTPIITKEERPRETKQLAHSGRVGTNTRSPSPPAPPTPGQLPRRGDRPEEPILGIGQEVWAERKR